MIVSSWYPPVLAGSSLWAESLVAALRRRGHDVRVVTTQWWGSGQEPEGSREEVVYRLPAWRVPRNSLLLGLSNVPVSYSLANRHRMLTIVRGFQPDVIHQINHIFDSIFLSAYAARKSGIPLVGSITTPIQHPTQPLLDMLMGMVDVGVLYTFALRYWQRIICSDAEQARYVTDHYGKRVDGRLVRHIFVGVHERISRGNSHERTPWPQIVTVGHVHAIRDPTNIIRAMSHILERFPDARFDIAGRVQFERPVEEVKRLGLESAVHFLGEVPAEQVSELVSRAHVFIILHQCKYAGLSFTAIEAMQFATPVIINAPDDLYGDGAIRDGENIMLVDGDDVAQIARKIICLLEDAALRRHIGHNGKQFVANYLNWDICAERTERLYEELIG